MRKTFLAVALLAFALPFLVPADAGAQQTESVGEAARKAREQKKTQAKAKRVFTNDTLPAGPGAAVSTVGSDQAPAPAATGAAAAAGDKAAGEKEEKGEEYWRKRFTDARAKLAAAEKELDILQRELNLNQRQYYDDPNQALREEFERKNINDKRKAIEEKQKEVTALRQAITALEDELRREGGNAVWAR